MAEGNYGVATLLSFVDDAPISVSIKTQLITLQHLVTSSDVQLTFLARLPNGRKCSSCSVTSRLDCAMRGGKLSTSAAIVEGHGGLQPNVGCLSAIKLILTSMRDPSAKCGEAPISSKDRCLIQRWRRSSLAAGLQGREMRLIRFFRLALLMRTETRRPLLKSNVPRVAQAASGVYHLRTG